MDTAQVGQWVIAVKRFELEERFNLEARLKLVLLFLDGMGERRGIWGSLGMAIKNLWVLGKQCPLFSRRS